MKNFQDCREARDLENLVDDIVQVADTHFTRTRRLSLGNCQEHTQPGAADDGELSLEVKVAHRYAARVGLEPSERQSAAVAWADKATRLLSVRGGHLTRILATWIEVSLSVRCSSRLSLSEPHLPLKSYLE